jgi:hypothetical protein
MACQVYEPCFLCAIHGCVTQNVTNLKPGCACVRFVPLAGDQFGRLMPCQSLAQERFFEHARRM